MTPEAQNWVETAEYDLATAHGLLADGRYPYVVFFCHLALEKMLKAHVAQITGRIPDRTHGLLALIQTSGLTIQQPWLDFLGRINNVSIATRYPPNIQHLVTQYTQPIAEEYLRRTEEILQWLRLHPNLGP